MDDPTTMTLDEIRDYMARRQIADPSDLADSMIQAEIILSDRFLRRLDDLGEHPIPATLDAIAGLMPPDLTWIRLRYIDNTGSWIAMPKDERWGEVARVPDTGNELLDRATLAYLAQIEQDKHKENA